MQAVWRWLGERAKDISSVLLGLLFLTFILQIVFRYVINLPLSWTQELCLTLWLWTVFWGAAFIVNDGDHVRFDIVYRAFGEPVRRVMAFIASAAIAAAFAASLPATINYVTFYKIKSSMTLGIRLDFVFSIYLVFAIAMILQCLVRMWRIATGRAFEPSALTASPTASNEQPTPAMDRAAKAARFSLDDGRDGDGPDAPAHRSADTHAPNSLSRKGGST